MGFTQITLGRRRLRVHKAIVEPDFGTATVLTTDAWDYVCMWLKRDTSGRTEDALYYWGQARSFFEATQRLPNDSACLTAYYCLLNATKALLSVKGEKFDEQHGVDGNAESGKACLHREKIKFCKNGVLPALCKYLGEPSGNHTYSLKDLFYNLAYVHRAYRLTYSSSRELFIPVENPRFVKKKASTEAWFCADIVDPRYANQHNVKKLPSGYEQDRGVDDRFIVRKRKRFTWQRSRSYRAVNIKMLTDYHTKVRQYLHYIHGPRPLWYIKQGQNGKSARNGQVIPRSSLTLTFSAMHRLSELARYDPKQLLRHFKCQHNWLLAEFIRISPEQFIDEISSEITGRELLTPGLRLRE